MGLYGVFQPLVKSGVLIPCVKIRSPQAANGEQGGVYVRLGLPHPMPPSCEFLPPLLLGFLPDSQGACTQMYSKWISFPI